MTRRNHVAPIDYMQKTSPVDAVATIPSFYTLYVYTKIYICRIPYVRTSTEVY